MASFSFKFHFSNGLLYGFLIGVLFFASIPSFSAILELPVSISNSTLIGDFSTILVSRDSIFFNGKPIGSSLIISKISVSANNPIIPELVSAINPVKGKFRNDSIVIQMDSNKPFHFLFKIMNTCGSLDVRNILLSVKNAKGNPAYVYLKIPTPDPSKTGASCEAGTKTTMLFSDTVITIGYKFGFLTSVFTNTKDSVHVFDKLFTILNKMRKKYSSSIDSKSIILAFVNNYSYSKVIKSLDFAYSFGFTNLEISKLNLVEDSASIQNICTIYGRSRQSITDMVDSHLGELKSLYLKFSKNNPNSSGQIVVKFCIAQSGKVASAQIKESSIKDNPFQKKVLETINKWNFGEIEKPGDTTEVVYPFVFGK